MYVEQEPLCVVPVGAADALLWAQGILSDVDLLLKAPLVPEAIFVVNLPTRGAYREFLRQVIRYHRAGAVCLIARTNNSVVAKHIIGDGAGIITFKEKEKVRMFSPPAAFLPWAAKLRAGSPKTPPQSPNRPAPGNG